MSFDPVVFGHRLRHYRRARGLTLDELGARVGRPTPYLSQLENGRREPKIGLIDVLARALGVGADDLLSPEPPNRRAELEVALQRVQTHPRFQALGLAELKPSARLPDEALEHVVRLFDALCAEDERTTADTLRAAVAATSRWLSEHDGYLDHVERAAERILAASGHDGPGALTSRHLNAMLEHVGYRVSAVDDVPVHIRSIVDGRERRIFVGQRNSLRTRQARKAILQTVGGIVLDHGSPDSVYEQQRQRLESAYFAAAVLVPERSAITALRAAKTERDLTIEDIKERYYVSYEMAAQRFTNLATRHLEIATHFIRSDPDGTVWKAYQNDEFPLPELHGAAEGRRLCRKLAGRTVYTSADRFDIHYQFTDTPAGSFWSATHVTPDHLGHALTTGVRYADARWFRGRRADHHQVSKCPDDGCCRALGDGTASVTAGHRMQAHLVKVLSGEAPPGVDEADLSEFLARHPVQVGASAPAESTYPDPWADNEEDG